MASILLIEDDRALGSLLQGELERAGYRCTWRETVADGLAEFERSPPDLLLLDLMLPDGSGYRVLAEVRLRSQVPVIILTARTMSQDKVLGLDLGADDYVTKPFWNDELIARIRARLRRPEAVGAGARSHLLGEVRVDLTARRVVGPDGERHLTPTEFDILAYLLQRRGRAVRREQLATACLNAEEAPDQSLQTHLSRLRRKLGADGQQIRTVWGIGYRIDAEELGS